MSHRHRRASHAIAAAALSAGAWGCVVEVPPREAAVPIDAATAGTATLRDAPPTGPAKEVLFFAGRPTRPYEVRAFVATCGWSGFEFSELREQAESAGADAVIELTAINADQCSSGVAVRLR